MIYFIFILFVFLTISSKYLSEKYYKITKPLTTIFIICVPFILGRNVNNYFDFLILFGLVFSLVGDLFLLNSAKYFTFGLLSFLITHIFYTTAIFSISTNLNMKALLLFLAVSTISIRIFNNTMTAKIFIYIIVISLMASLAFNLLLIDRNDLSVKIFTAGVLFLISDFTLAYNRFIRKFFAAELIILITYFTSQFLFAMSI